MSRKTSESFDLRSQWSYSQDIHFRISKKSTYWTNRHHLWHPPTDLLETEKSFIVRVEIAGMEHAEMTIAIEDLSLAIHGVRQQETEQAAFHQMEIRFGEFLSLVQLPGPVDSDRRPRHAPRASRSHRPYRS